MNGDQKRVIIQIALFIATCITTTLAGTQMTYGISIYSPEFTWQHFVSGLDFSVPFLFILTVHEFGHYFMARYHKIKVTLPYYIPVPPLQFLLLNLGTLGAVIRLRERVYSKKQNFDIGISGPLAGFVAALAILYYGFANLPEPEYIFQFHPEYQQYGLNYADHVYKEFKQSTLYVEIGKNLLFLFFENFVADPSRVPHPSEIMHYPVIFAGFLSLVFTFLNLLPIGQLDGGHVSYGLFGFKTHRIIATIIFIALLIYAGIGVVSPNDDSSELIVEIPLALLYLYIALSGLGLTERNRIMYMMLIFTCVFLISGAFPTFEGYQPWLLFGLIIGRLIGIQHPPSEIEEPLDTKRILLGWIALIIFVICFAPAPLIAELIIVEPPVAP
jgi:membrane-associated protease RseP (regulator of RpoE activity)